MKKRTISTQALLGVKCFSRNGILTVSNGEIIYFLISPTNISVLSRANIAQKIRNLMQLLSVQPEIEIICTDARENYGNNQFSLSKLFELESNEKIRELLDADRRFLDNIQIEMSTSREFMFAVRLREEYQDQSFANLNRLEQLINEQGLNCRRANKDDTKRFLSIYFGINKDEEQIDDIDGESKVIKWVIQN